MAWDENGAGPVVCLIHGFPLNRKMWTPQVSALNAAGFRVITPDLRGFGESEAPDSAYSIDLFADDTAALFDYLGIVNAVVGGMSMGGYILQNLLERYPEKVSAACFIVTRSGADDEAGKKKRIILARDVMEFGSKAIADIFVKLLFAEQTGEMRPELVGDVYKLMLENDPRGLAGALLAMRERKDYTPLLSGFQQPSLIIGAEQDKAVTPEQIRTLAARLPNGRLCLIPDAGHMVSLEQPEAFNHCLLDFLKSLPLE
jgi:pimeloyl-ACP methyl ester carboxylesterase